MKRKIPRAAAHAQPLSTNITARKIGWLQRVCGEQVSALEMRLAVLLVTRYVSQSKSLRRFEKENVLVAWPAQTQLAEVLDNTRQGISKAAHKLEQRGFLKIKAGLGRGWASEYRLVEKANRRLPFKQNGKGNLQSHKRQTLGTEKATARRGKGKPQLPHHRSSTTLNHHRSHHRDDSGDFSQAEKVKRKKDSRHPVFSELYDLWPNKDKDWDRAKGAWVNAVASKGVNPDLVLRRAKAWIALWEEEGVSFRPYLGKWIAEHGWEQRPQTRDEKNLAAIGRERSAYSPDEQDDDDVEEDEYQEDDEDEDVRPWIQPE